MPQNRLWGYQVHYTIDGRASTCTRSLTEITKRTQVPMASMSDLRAGRKPEQRGVETPGWRITFLPPAEGEDSDPALNALVEAERDPTKRVRLVISSPSVLAQTLEDCFVVRNNFQSGDGESPMQITFDVIQGA